MKTRSIKTKLFGREEVFRILALGEALRVPILLEGPPGTGKSQAMTDYGGGEESVFKVELDTGSKASEIKGFMDMKALLEEKQYRTISPIAKKKLILINEVEKGSSEIRNTLLSIMQERELQLGSEGTRECEWELFAGSCNSIPADERREPFWDRFLIKTNISPLTIDEMKQARRGKEYTLQFDIPSREDLPMISQKMLDKFDELVATHISDRARINVERIASGVKFIWGVDDYQALCKAASFLCPTQVSVVSSNLIDKDVVEIKTLIKNIESSVDYDTKVTIFANLRKVFERYVKRKDRDEEMVADIKEEIKRVSTLMEHELKKHEGKK